MKKKLYFDFFFLLIKKNYLKFDQHKILKSPKLFIFSLNFGPHQNQLNFIFY